jgi:hypothetical protein
MLPWFVTLPLAPVTKTPNELPEIDPVELFVMLPPASISAPAPAVALMLPALLSVAAAPCEKTPADWPEIEPEVAFVTLPPAPRPTP